MSKVETQAKKSIEAATVPVGAEKAAFAALIEKYKVQNPVKYELKKDVLAAKLATL